MKKFRLFFKGSPKELKFVDKWKQRGYFLTSVDHFIYNFETNSTATETTLAVEYMDQKMAINLDEDPALLHSLQKKLLCKNFHIVYNYYQSERENYILDNTSKTQIKYLEKLKDRLLLFSNLFTFMCALSWMFTAMSTLSWINVSMFAALLTMLAPFSWIAYAIFASKINGRISAAGKRAGLLESDLHPPITIIIKKLKEKPAIDDLTYLGTWQFVVTKKDEHYFKLTTSFSEEQVKNDVSSFLNIDLEDVEIVSSLGLAPIGYFM